MAENFETAVPSNFIKHIIDEDISFNKNNGQVVTRFPPEPNGYLHIGHAKSICLNFGMAKDYKGKCHLRFDDTNPEKESEEFVESIKTDVKWLGFDWGENLFYASDYFERLYQLAIELIKNDMAFVCELDQETQRSYRGDLKNPGKESPFRNRPVEESLKLFKEMREGQYENGQYVLRAKIDMASPNMHMRDPVLYRIKKVSHQRTQNDWPIYPMYDFTHCLSDSFEGITHSLCTLEFEEHRPLYDWIVEKTHVECHPKQIEFARLNLEYTIMSKRFLQKLVDLKKVDGWDDPRMPTISGMRKRGYPSEAIVKFCERIGVTKKGSSISLSTLESIVRDELAEICPRVLGVVNPLKVIITNWEDSLQWIDCPYHPQNDEMGSRKVPFGKEIYIEQDDFCEDPPKKYFRLSPNKSVRLRYAYVITCDEVIKDNQGKILEIHSSYHKDTFAGVTPEGMKKVKGIINWVESSQGIPVKLGLYDRLFQVPQVGVEKDYLEELNPHSLEVVNSFVEPSLRDYQIEARFQFERQGYFKYVHSFDDNNAPFSFHRIIGLKDSWAKINK